MLEDNFVLSFTHRVPENSETLIYYAFTYPFTCAELEDYLQNIDKKYKKSLKYMDMLIQNIKKKTVITNKKKDEKPTEIGKIDSKTASLLIFDAENGNVSSSQIENEISKSSLPIGVPNLNDVDEIISNLDINNDNPTNIDQEQTTSKNLADIVDIINPMQPPLNNADCREEIYYYRELVINSLQGRRVDFLTITSFHGITDEREPRLENLFPDLNQKRCHVFENKKV